MDPYLGEIRMVGFGWAPMDWELCAGQLLQISQYDTLYALIGTAFGGDGVNNFALPDLRGRLPIHIGGGYAIGSKVGSETVALDNSNYLPAHSHSFPAAADGSTAAPVGAVFGGDSTAKVWGAPDGGQMAPSMIGSAGGGQAHENRMPYQCVNFIIAVNGLWPPRE